MQCYLLFLMVGIYLTFLQNMNSNLTFEWNSFRNTSDCNFQLLTQISFQVLSLVQILQTKAMIFGNFTNTTCRFSFKQKTYFIQFKT